MKTLTLLILWSIPSLQASLIEVFRGAIAVHGSEPSLARRVSVLLFTLTRRASEGSGNQRKVTPPSEPPQAAPCELLRPQIGAACGDRNSIVAAMQLPSKPAPMGTSEGWRLRASLGEEDDRSHAVLQPSLFNGSSCHRQLVSSPRTTAVLLHSPLYPIPLRC
jgi:hypothetical protein